jgi:hypothetical protein
VSHPLRTSPNLYFGPCARSVSDVRIITSTFECRRGVSHVLILVAALAPLLSSAQGLITTVAGSTGVFPSVVNRGPAISAPLASVSGVAVDSAGNVFVADSQENMVAKIAPDGSLAVIAGNRGVGFLGDGGLAVSTQLDNPGSLAVDAGNLYIAVLDRIRKVTPAGLISTVAGNGQSGFSGDGGPATSAQFNFPTGIAVDRAGNLYITDTGNNRIRKVAPGGIINTVEGSGQVGSFAGFSGDGGAAVHSTLNRPVAVSIDATGDLYIADSMNSRIREITLAGS